VHPSFPKLFARRVLALPNGCWRWTRTVLSNGYGQVTISCKRGSAHRTAYEMARGPVPDGLVLDHLCRFRACVNPDDLEPVTNRINILRGPSPAAWFAVALICTHGHSLEDAHLRPSGGRTCRVCRVASGKRNGERRRVARLASGGAVANRDKTHCIHGHPLADCLTRQGGHRHCRVCHRERQREYRNRLHAEPRDPYDPDDDRFLRRT